MSALATLEREKRLIKVSIARMQTRILEHLKKAVNAELIDSLELDLADLRLAKASFDEIQKKIYSELVENLEEGKPEHELDNEWGAETEKVRAAVVNLVCRVNTAKRSLESTTSRESLLNTTFREVPESTGVRLPKIEVPTFSGDIRDWNDFASLFRNLVDQNPSLSSVQKLYYLKLAARGQALDIIKDYAITDANYTEVWNALSNRYDNKRATIKAHLNDFFGLTKIKSEKELRKLLDESSKALRSLKSLGENVENWNTVVTYWISSRLDDKTAREWEISITDFSKFPALKQLKTFLAARAAIMEEPTSSGKPEKFEKKSEMKKYNETPKTKTNLLASRVKCYVCHANHYLTECEEFKKKNAEQRFEIVKANGLCINCFCKKHSTSECKGPKCRKCDRRHHTLLHRQNADTKETTKSEFSCDEKFANEDKKTSLHVKKSTNSVILPTAVVRIVSDRNQGFKWARVILDSGSQTNLISESLIRRLRLATYRNDSLLGCLAEDSIYSDRACTIEILPRHSDELVLTITADVIANIPYDAPSAEIERLCQSAKIEQPAECDFNAGKVEILIGAEFYERCIEKNRRFYNDIAIRKTIFGEIILGRHSEVSGLQLKSPNKCFLTVDDQLQRFWETEEIDVPRESNYETEACVKHFESTFERDIDGRFVVRLPLKGQPSNLSRLFYRAENSLKRLEKNCKVEMKDAVNEFMKDYQKKGHMRLVLEETLDVSNYFIPFQVVFRPTSVTTKVRVVFNASAKTKNKASLNDILMKGPQLQRDIMTILANFRRYRVAFTADIQQMYRQIRVHPEDAKLQRILWRYDPAEQVKQYELSTLTYGTTPASFIATKCLAVIANDVVNQFLAASRAISNEFYMDDLMTGAENLEDAVILQRQIHSTLLNYGLPLRKYVSNSRELLEKLDNHLTLDKNVVNLTRDDGVSVLCLLWVPELDVFQVKISLHELPAQITKRSMLSELAKIFDPLGFLAPATIKGKLLLQKLWRHQLQWDQAIPTDLLDQYVKFRKQLSNVGEFHIERKFCDHESHDDIWLSGFSDASEQAYAAVIYLRCRNDENRHSYILCAKTRVAPLKGSTIPRLELRGAELLAELIDKLAPIMKVRPEKIECFSDSTIVLSWLNKAPDELKTFVANRVKKTLSLVPLARWKYVSGKENPADLATRGIKVLECNSELWLKGPPWLRTDQREEDPITWLHNELPEVKKSKKCLLNVTRTNLVSELIERFSNYGKLVRVLAYVLRFSVNSRSKSYRSLGKITLSEIDRANLVVLRAVQVQSYANEIDSLLRKGRVPRKSSLFTFDPFLDQNGLLRVGGRLEDSSFSYDRKHPVLIHAKTKFTCLYLTYLHNRYFHASVSFLITLVSQRYRFVAGLKNVVKRICRECVVCRRYSNAKMQQKMGQLPSERITVSRPFATSGVDYAGPFVLKPVGHRSKVRYKSYVAVFVCYCTRAVHLEVVSNLTTGAFFATLKRFVSRRGCPNVLYSDNATNFWGTANLLNDGQIESYSSSHKLTWKFNPPRAPHFGGMFEAAVGAMKKHLVKTVGKQILTFEELSTLTAEIEAILNSRPVSINDEDELDNYLTPGHFLTSTHILIPPEIDDSAVKLPVRWRLVQDLKSSFWQRWRHSYLNSFQKFGKWHSESTNLQPNDIVFLKDDVKSPAYYPLGRVTRVLPGKDGKVRVVEVRTSRGTYLRAINKLSPAVGNVLKEE